MNRTDLAAGLVLALLGVAAFLHAGQALPFRAGLMPRVAAALLVLFGIALSLRGLRTAAPADAPVLVLSAPRLAVATALTAAFLLLLPWVGFIAGASAYLAAAGWLFGFRRPLPLVVTAAGFAVGAKALFEDIFRLRLPEAGFLPALGLG